MHDRPLVVTPPSADSPHLAVQPTGVHRPPAPGFFDGIRCFFGGLGFMLKTPGTWPLALVPVIVVLVLGGVLSGLAIHFVPEWAQGVMKGLAGDDSTLDVALAASFAVLLTVIAVVVSAFVAFTLSMPISGPAFEALVRRQEAELGLAPRGDTSFVSDVWLALKSSLLGLLIATPILVVLFLIGFFFPPASVVTVPLKVLVAVIVLAWDVCDVPLGLRGVGARRRVAVLGNHIGAVLGMAAGVGLLTLIPCGILFAMPIGVLGATRLVVAIEAAEGALRG